MSFILSTTAALGGVLFECAVIELHVKVMPESKCTGAYIFVLHV